MKSSSRWLAGGSKSHAQSKYMVNQDMVMVTRSTICSSPCQGSRVLKIEAGAPMDFSSRTTLARFVPES